MSKNNLESVRLQEILEHFPDGMFIIDTEMDIQYVNPAFCKLIGYSEIELLGTSITDYLGDLTIMDSCNTAIAKNGYCNDQETIFKRKDGSVVHISKNVQALYDQNGQLYRILVSIRDLTALHRLNKELLEAKFDTLTKLPNRTRLLNDLEEFQSPLTLILLNIDSFKEINSFYGHEIADQLLIAFSSELVDYARGIPNATVYKLPVDEYVILVKNSCSKEEIDACITNLSGTLNKKTFDVAGNEISLNISIGIAGSDGSSNYRNEIVHQADMALDQAKKLRKDYFFFDESLQIKKDYESNLQWIKRLRNAIDKDLIVPFYQPIVDAKSLTAEKFEALVRIVEEDGTVITPYQFLEISKKVKLYHRITMIMIEKVIESLYVYPDYRFSVNLSIEDIDNKEMFAYIVDKIKNCPHSSRLIFEILESEGIENYDTVSEFIREMKRYGAQVAIDDFGAGYSNFAYITQLDIDYIKIDGSIIRDINTNKTSQIITKTIVDFASQLGIETVAEFVWSQEVYEYLQNLSIGGLQGYYFAEPSRFPTPVVR